MPKKAWAVLILCVTSLLVNAQTGGKKLVPQNLQFQFVPIQVPGSYLTRATGVNLSGDVVGEYQYLDESDTSQQKGFLLRKGVFSTIEFPGAVSTVISGINRSGVMVGTYNDATGDHGFRLENGTFTSINFPGALATGIHGINDPGDIVGYYLDQNGFHGFILQGKKFVSLGEVILTGINRKREAVGGNVFYHGGSATTLHYPGADAGSDFAASINNFSLIAGFSDVLDESGNVLKVGWLSVNGNFGELQMPGAVSTQAWGVSDIGIVVGSWRSNEMRWPLGFVAIPVLEP